jgi:hypothetical protein
MPLLTRAWLLAVLAASGGCSGLGWQWGSERLWPVACSPHHLNGLPIAVELSIFMTMTHCSVCTGTLAA